MLRRMRAELSPASYHDEQVWRDLDMDDVFARLDHTLSWPGMQVLCDRLGRHDHSDADLARLHAESEVFRENAETREWYADRLLALGDWSASALPLLLWGAPPPVPRYVAGLKALTMTSILSLVATVVWPPAFVVCIAVALVNVFVISLLRTRTQPWLPSLRALPVFLRTVAVFAKGSGVGLDSTTARLAETWRALLPLQRFTRFVKFDDGSVMGGLGAELAGAARELLNLLFLLDLHAFYGVAGALANNRHAAQEAFLALGEIDVARALASLRSATPVWTRPVPGEVRQLRVTGLVHPLISSPVPVDLTGDGRSWIVTGSNMSGKSTFLRSLGVGTLMARSLGTVFASRWECPAFRVSTCIGRSDAITEGKSYYMAEVQRVRDLITLAHADEPCLFLVDELFRGTNTTERVAAGLAVLEALDRSPHLVMVATHDVELLAWLRDRYDAWHFREDVAADGLSFDYILRPGPGSTRNAIALLGVMGYPAEVVARAREVAGQGAPTET